MDDKAVWDTFDGLFKVIFRQGRKIDELEGRVAALEKKLAAGEAKTSEDERDDHDDAGSGEAATQRPRLATTG